MRTKTALKIRLLNAEGKSLRQIAEAVDLSADEIEDYLLTAGLTPTYTVKQGRQENPKRKEIRNYMENQRVLGVPMKKRGLTQEQRRQIQTEFERGTRVAEIAARFDRDVSYIYKLRREWRAEQTKTQEDKTMNNENTQKSPAPVAAGTDEKDNNVEVITNDNDTTNSRACQAGLSMSTGGGKSYMMMKALHETEEE
nr:MAG TPA_asm: Middle operon regulator, TRANSCRIPTION.2A [Caudoviricetes sp.]